MRHAVKISHIFFLTVGLVASAGNAQTNVLGRSTDTFTAENAIVDTAIPFAIGAREAQQSLRGSYGWPTFQEGLVEGVYFRFDPDGYARFSPNPRLDVDVFEVICKSRTRVCVARKDGLNMFLDERGQLQLKFESVTPNDTFFVSEGISEIQIPSRILQPLDTQMENLLATGGELIVRRGGEEISKFSLKGFVATVAFLRWIQAGQNYAVLPRDWPVPNSSQPEVHNMKVAENWQTPMPQPHNVVSGVSDVQAELRELRLAIAGLSQRADGLTGAHTDPGRPDSQDAAALMEVAEKLQSELERLGTFQDDERELFAEVDQGSNTNTAPPAEGSIMSAGQKIEYLMTKLGLDMHTAVAVVEMAESDAKLSGPAANQNSDALIESASDTTFGNSVVDQILEELEMEVGSDTNLGVDHLSQSGARVENYELLTSYFRSVVFP